jgi:hypothetical protein
MPYLGRTQAASNLAAHLVDHETPSHDLTMLSPDRYA